MNKPKTPIVSQETANIIECLKKLQSLSDDVYNALSQIYGATVCESLMNSNFHTEYNNLEACIQKFLMFSISNNIGEVDSDKI